VIAERDSERVHAVGSVIAVTLCTLKPGSSQATGFRIGEIAEQAGVNTSLIRYYERIGLLPAPERVSGQRRYDATVLRRLTVIDVAQRAGLSLDEIRELVGAGTGEPVSDHLREIAARKLPEIQALIDRAQRVRAWLHTATGCGCETIDECALFDEPSLDHAPSAGPPIVVHTRNGAPV
jgi:MerR family redox-sensitive transcriptional activator SoxR